MWISQGGPVYELCFVKKYFEVYRGIESVKCLSHTLWNRRIVSGKTVINVCLITLLSHHNNSRLHFTLWHHPGNIRLTLSWLKINFLKCKQISLSLLNRLVLTVLFTVSYYFLNTWMQKLGSSGNNLVALKSKCWSACALWHLIVIAYMYTNVVCISTVQYSIWIQYLGNCKHFKYL